LSRDLSKSLPLKLSREAEITYDQLILRQLSRCSRPMDVLDFVKCVMNLLALLPPDIRLEVQKREGAIYKAIEKEKEVFCGSPSNYQYKEDYRKCLDAKKSDIARKAVEDLDVKNYYYIVYHLVFSDVLTYVYCQNLLLFAIAVDVLHEKGLIGFEAKQVYIGGPNVPRKPNKMVDKQ